MGRAGMSEGAVQGPRAVAAQRAPFEVEFLNEQRLPAVLRPAGAGDRGPEAVAALLERDDVRLLLRRYGAVLFRGYDLPTESAFTDVVARHYGDEASAYVGGISPRTAVRESQIYESTKIPAALRIHQHNEMAYMKRAPRDLLFFCDIPSPEGGETPLTDCRKLMQEVPEEIRDTFKRRGLRNREHFYGRFWNFWTFGMHTSFVRLHRSWPSVFNTHDRDEVRRICKSLNVRLQWIWDGSIRLTCRRPPTAHHPDTGEEVWFNQASTLNVTAYVYGWLKYLGYHIAYPFTRYRPFDVSYSDKGRIPHSYLRAIQQATDRVTTAFPWQKGDLLWIDNFLVAHGRMAYKGPRRILVAIGPMVDSV